MPKLLQHEDFRYMQRLAGYLPTPLLHELGHTRDTTEPSGWKRLTGSLLLVDISGFTAMSERLQSQSQNGEGVEELTRVLNRYFNEVLQLVADYNGQSLKFGGDSLLVFFEGRTHAQHAAACAFEIQQHIIQSYRLLPTIQGVFPLDMSIGLHTGEIFTATIGQAAGDGRLEYLICGPDLQITYEAESVAENGEIVVTAPFQNLLRRNIAFEFQPISRSKKNFFRLHACTYLPNPSRTAPAWWLKATPDNLKLIPHLERFLPRLLRNRLRTIGRLPRQTELDSEHRTVTTVFILVNGLDSHLEQPEDQSAVLTEFDQLFQKVEILTDIYGGNIVRLDSQPAGERILILFGAPTNYEDDVARAALALLELRRQLTRTEPNTARLSHRFGMTTGKVFSAEVGAYLVGGRAGASRCEYTVMGNSINLAARLASCAGVDQILLDETSRQALLSAFETVALPTTLKFKGFRQNLLVSRLVGPRQNEPDPPTAQPELVGYKTELTKLQKLARQIRADDGQTFVLSGPPGIGKTLLAQRLVAYCRQNGYRVIWGEATAHYQDTLPYKLWLDLLLQLTVEVDKGQDRYEQVKRLVEQHTPQSQQYLWTLQKLWQIERSSQTANFAHLDSQDFKGQFFRLVQEILASLATEQPVLVVFDRLEWIDSGSLQLFTYLSNQLRNRAVLLGALYRLDTALAEATASREVIRPFETMLNELDDLHLFELNGLNLTESKRLLAQRLGVPTSTIPADLSQDLQRQTGGNPLYLQELIGHLRDSGRLLVEPAITGLVATRARVVQVEQKANTVPPSLQSLIMSRVDRLPISAQQVIKVASVVGLYFKPSDLVCLTPLAPADLQAVLHTLTLQDFVQPAEAATYNFRQALVQRTIYESLAFSQRRQLHRKLAIYIEELDGTDHKEKVGLLAYHYALSDDAYKAIRYSYLAANQAFDNFSYQEALKLYEQTLRLAQTFNLSLELGQQYQLLFQVAQAARFTNRPQTAIEYCQSLRSLAAQHAEKIWEAESLILESSLTRVGGSLTQAESLARQALRLATELANPELIAKSHEYLGGVFMMSEAFEEAQTHLTQSYELINRLLTTTPPPADPSKVQIMLAQNLNNRALIYIHEGHYSQAQPCLKQAYVLMRDLNLKYWWVLFANNLGELHQELFDAATALGYHSQALKVATELGINDLECDVLRNIGIDYSLMGKTKRATTYLKKALDLAVQLNNQAEYVAVLYALGDNWLAAGQVERAAEVVFQLLENNNVVVAGPLQASVNWLQARVLLSLEQPELVETLLNGLITQAAEQWVTPHLVWQAHYLLYRLYVQDSRFNAAYQQLDQAKLLLNQILADLGSEATLYLKLPLAQALTGET